MSPISMSNPSSWLWVASIAVHLGAGLLLGILYFYGVWWNARLFASGGRMGTSILVMLSRIALLGVVLTLASLKGALPLLVTAVGILLGRFIVMRRLRNIAA